MIIEMILGMSVLVYAMNMYSSLVKEERRRANQSRDLCLEISGFNEKMLSETVALTIQDYEKIQKISSGKTFFYIALPEFYVANDKNYEFTMILADYDKRKAIAIGEAIKKVSKIYLRFLKWFQGKCRHG